MRMRNSRPSVEIQDKTKAPQFIFWQKQQKGGGEEGGGEGGGAVFPMHLSMRTRTSAKRGIGGGSGLCQLESQSAKPKPEYRGHTGAAIIW